MSEHVNFLLLGLANGAVFAALGLALTVTYRSSGVMNFATSSIALFTAYTYAGLRQGELLVMIPGLPSSVRLADSLPFLPSAGLALVLSALLGLVLYVAVFRPLRAAPAVARAVGSLGVMVVMTGVMVQRLGTRPPPVERILPAGAFEVGDVRVSKDRALFALAVMAIAAGVWAITRFTRFGLLTRACAQSEKGAHVSGISPGRVAAANWMLSAVVCGCAGILIAPIVPLVPVQYTLFVVPALAVAVLGRFERLLPVVLGGLAVGMLQSEITYLRTQHTWLPSSGLSELVPLVLLLLVLVAWAKPLPGRGEVLRQALGRAPRPRAIAPTAALGVGAGTIALASLGSTYRAALVTSLILAVIALSYVVVTGYSGQVSLAQLTLAGVAGFLVGDIGLPFPLAPILAAACAALVGVVVGLPAVRIRGLPVAVVTLALAVAVEAVWFRNTDFVSSSGKDVDGPEILGLDLAIGSGRAYPRLGFCLLVLGVLVLTAWVVARLRTSPLGAAMLAVKANERAAAAAGIDVVRTKVAAFAIAGFIAGIGGALLAYRQGNVTVDSFAVLVGLSLFATAYLAGITSVSGAVVAGMIGAGGLVFTFLDEHLSFGRWFTTIGGIGLVFTVVRNPEGIVGPAHQRIERWRQRRPATSPRPAAAPATPTPTGPARSSANGTPALELRDVSVQYGGVRAVDRVSFTVAPGAIVGLIGPNGAGKTSLIDAVSGFSLSTGEIMLDGRRIDHLRPFERSRAGLGRTFQSVELYDDMTAQENVQADDLLALLQLTEHAERPAGQLSQGARQVVSVARALARRPKVLLLDEPAAGLDPAESAWLGDRLLDIRNLGTSLLLVDHDMSLVLGICDEVHVLDLGRRIAGGPPAEVRSDPLVTAAYLGVAP